MATASPNTRNGPEALLSLPPLSLHYRLAGLLYASLAFAGTWLFFACLIIFLGNLPSPSDPWLSTTVDVGSQTAPAIALLSNAGLVLLFGVQHSVMARPWFKRSLHEFLPPELERATYVHAANIAGLALIFLWSPIPEPLWKLNNTVLEATIWTCFGGGWAMLFAGACSINLFELLGLRQAAAWATGRQATSLRLKTAWIYGYIEHPMYVGVLLGLWMSPVMTIGHALLASLMTIYILIGMHYERRDLRQRFGAAYIAWRKPEDQPRGQVILISSVVEEPLPRRMCELLDQLDAAAVPAAP